MDPFSLAAAPPVVNLNRTSSVFQLAQRSLVERLGSLAGCWIRVELTQFRIHSRNVSSCSSVFLLTHWTCKAWPQFTSCEARWKCPCWALRLVALAVSTASCRNFGERRTVWELYSRKDNSRILINSLGKLYMWVTWIYQMEALKTRMSPSETRGEEHFRLWHLLWQVLKFYKRKPELKTCTHANCTVLYCTYKAVN